ncbi:MAG: prolyl oligopeptidase family serine peptidase [Gemmatimonas sp.]|uniref:prolyl oligopeptidase family serine peptidase n=1 Tax=Gemmatimonas sp. TaxID=1962908 RepID=UPI00391F7574|nr:prolyl oligopeptidase family serine peptidase [Gemmatimonadota bacterium]
MRCAVRLATAALAVASRAAAAQPLTLDQVVQAAPITGPTPSALTWAPDGRTLAFAWDSSGSAVRDVWLVAHDGRNRRALTALAGTRDGVRELAWHANGRVLYALRGEAFVRVNAVSGALDTIAAVGRDAHDIALSPTGTHAAFLREGDVWLVALDGAARNATPRPLTRVAVPSIAAVPLGTYARLDREIGPGTWGTAAPSFSWAPDGRTLAVHLVDRRAVRTVPFPYYLGAETQVNMLRRPYPGDPNESRHVALVDVASGAMTMLPFDAPTAVQIVNYAWSPQGVLLVDRESDDATQRWVHVVRPTQAPQLVYRDARASRIYTEIASAWSHDGRRVLLTTDRDDRYRVFAVTPGDTVPVALTPAASDVQGAAQPLPGGGIAWLSSAPVVAERHLWRADPGQAPVQVTRRAGTHRVLVAPDGRTAASLVSDDVTPPHLLLIPMRGGAEVVVTPPGGRGLAAAGLVAPRYVRFAGAVAAETLHAKVWLPAAAQRGGRVPVLFGPVYSNTVRNRWGGTYGLLQQLLVQRGYAVVQVDVRGSTGYGRAFREAFLFEWGGRDLDDLAATAHWLGREAWADTSRLGIFGSSYGGLITVYALFKRPGLFKAGVAGAPATDPRFFGSDDVAITRRPGTHPEAFRRGALPYAGGLRDHLMLIHGLMDDVVPFKTTADLAEELMRQGKDFDLVIAPSATHGWTARPPHARYLLGKLVQHFDRHLGGRP